MTQGHNVMEIMMEHVAHGLGMDASELKCKNLMKKGDRLVTPKTKERYLEEENPMHSIIEKLSQSCQLSTRRAAIHHFNKVLYSCIPL